MCNSRACLFFFFNFQTLVAMMELGIGKRRRRRLSMGFRHRTVVVRVCALALVALLLSCEASNAQQWKREPALDVDALEDDVEVAAVVVPEMAPVEDTTTRSTNSGTVEDWKDRKTPSVSDQRGGEDALSTSSDAVASALATGDEPREQPIIAEETGVHVVDPPHEPAAAAAAAVASTSASSDTDVLSVDDGGVGDGDGGATDNGDNDDADDGAASRPGDHRLDALHPNSNSERVPPAEEDGLGHVSVAGHDQETATVVVHAANGEEKGEKGGNERGGGGDGVEQQQQQQQQQQQETETETEESLNESEMMVNGTESSSTNAHPEEEACRDDTATAAVDGRVEARNDHEDDDDGPVGGTNDASPDIEPSDSAGAYDAPTSGSSGDGVGSVDLAGSADQTAAATAAATTDQRLPSSESEHGSSVDRAGAFHAAESTATADVQVETAEAAASGDDGVAGSFDDEEGRTALGAADAPSVGSSGPADSRGERQPTRTPSELLPDTDKLADDARVFAGHEESPGMDEGVREESAGRESSTLDGSNGRAGRGRYQPRHNTDGQVLGTRRGDQDNDGETTSSDGDGGGGGGGRDAGADFARASQEELAQRVRQMEAEVMRKLLAEEDAKSLLDIWVERAREYVLTRTIPPTDAECDFNWSRLRCEPKCLCGARLRFGDYTPGRTCRLLHHWERSPECEAAWDPSDEPAVRRLAATVAWGLGSAKRAYEARVAPPSDPECVFDLESRRCQPQSLCRLKFRWGDLTPSGACRLVQEEKAAASAASGVPL